MYSRAYIPGNRTDHVEDLKKHGLGDGGVKLANIKGRGRSGRDRSLRGGGIVGCWDRHRGRNGRVTDLN